MNGVWRWWAEGMAMAGDRDADPPGISPLVRHGAAALAAGQEALHQALNAPANRLAGMRYAVRSSTMDVAFVMARSRELSARVGVWPLNLGFAALHGIRREDASRLRFEVVRVPLPQAAATDGE